MAFVQFLFKRKANINLALRNEEINQQNEEISTQRDEIINQKEFVTEQRDKITEQNQKIMDSILYASKIQNAVLPPFPFMKKLLPNHFLIYKPRDIVSGDYYWLSKKANKVLIAVADCTGQYLEHL